MIPKIAPKRTALKVNSGTFADSGMYGRNSPRGAVEFHAVFVVSTFDAFATRDLRQNELRQLPFWRMKRTTLTSRYVSDQSWPPPADLGLTHLRSGLGHAGGRSPENHFCHVEAQRLHTFVLTPRALLQVYEVETPQRGRRGRDDRQRTPQS